MISLDGVERSYTAVAGDVIASEVPALEWARLTRVTAVARKDFDDYCPQPVSR